MLKKYGVETAKGSRITTVYAKNVEAARERAIATLDRPGRYGALQKWEQDNQPLRDMETDEVSTL